MLNFLYGPILTSIHDYWKSHSFDYTDLSASWWFCFSICCLGFCCSFSSKEKVSSNIMAAVTICSDFGAKENKIFHCFHCYPIYLPWSDRTGCHDLGFWMQSFKPTFWLTSFTFIKRLFSSSSLSGGVICISEIIDISPRNLDSSLSFTQISISHDVLFL